MSRFGEFDPLVGVIFDALAKEKGAPEDKFAAIDRAHRLIETYIGSFCGDTQQVEKGLQDFFFSNVSVIVTE